MSTSPTQSTRKLRQRAEEKLAFSRATNSETQTPVDALKLLHELQVHQIELEMQNEELRQIIAERDGKDALLGRYSDLCDAAPAGYFTLDHAADIHTVNLTGTELLGVERDVLINRCLDSFVSEQSRPAFKDFIKKVFTSNAKEVCEVVFEPVNHSPIHVQIDAVVTESRKTCRAVIVDITRHKQSEKALTEASLKLEALMAAVPVGISFSDDISCQRITGNPTVLEQFNVSTEDNLSASALDPDVPGRKIRFFLDGREITDAELPMQRAISENQVIPPMELKVVMPNGKHWFTQASGAPVRDAQGNVICGIAVTHDITERKLAEEALRQQTLAAQHLSEQEFHALAEAMPQIVWATRPDGWNIYFNQQWVDYTGLTMEESYGHGWNKPFHPDDRQRAWDAWSRATQSNERYSLECRLRRADGVYRWWLIRGEPMRCANGDILKWFGTCTDIEELKCAEAALLQANERLEQRVAERTIELTESEQQFRVLIQNLQSAVALINDSGEFTIVNRAFLRMFELDDHSNIKNVNDRDWSQWQVFDEYGSLLDVEEHPVRQAVRTGRPVRDKLVAVKAPGSIGVKWLLISAEPTLDAQGRIHHLICTYHDFTGRKLAENELRLSEERFRSVAENLSEGLMLFNPQGTLIYQNQASMEMHGYSAQDDRRIALDNLAASWQVWDEQGRSLPFEQWPASRVFRGERFQNQVLHACRSDTGKAFDASYNGNPVFDADGSLVLCFITIRDITEQRQAEARLRKSEERLTEQAEQLRENDRRKDEFLAMLAHELRNPLAPIRNAVEIQKLANSDPSRISWCTNIIDRQINHLTGLVDDLLDISRISRGLIELKKERLEIRDFIQLAIESNQPLIEARRHKFSMMLPSEPLWVEGDRIRLAQILSNLINNAVKYTQEQGSIRLSVEPFDDKINIRVTDNGCGLDQISKTRLFDPFYQADCSLDRSQGGLGLGLSIVHRLVEKHGGDIQAFSAGQGQGCEFVVGLPRLFLSEAEIASSKALTAQILSKLSILLVDDNHDITESLAILLEIEGHQVQTANNGYVALEIAKTERPDVILLDIGLPGMNGYEVAQELRRNRELDRIKLIALTGYGRIEDQEKSRASGFNDHLVKPLNIELLRTILNKYKETSC